MSDRQDKDDIQLRSCVKAHARCEFVSYHVNVFCIFTVQNFLKKRKERAKKREEEEEIFYVIKIKKRGMFTILHFVEFCNDFCHEQSQAFIPFFFSFPCLGVLHSFFSNIRDIN